MKQRKKNKRNWFQKTFSVIFALFLLMSCFVACKSKTNSKTNSDETVIQATNIDLVKNGTSEYTLVLPALATDYETYAVEEFVGFMKESTGHSFQVITDKDVHFDKTQKVISIGRTNLLKESGVTVSYEELTESGFIIKRLDNTLLLCGGGNYGTLYAVYEFLSQQIAWEAYGPDEIYFIKTRNIKLLDFNYKDKPALEYRSATWYLASSDPYFAAKWRCTTSVSKRLFNEQLWYSFPHSMFETVHPRDYASDHPDWYTADQMQPCLTNKGFKEQFVINLKQVILENPTQVFFPIGLEDSNNTMCKCVNCKAEIEQYTATGLLIRWTNELVEKIIEWKQAECIVRDIYIPMMAYYETLKPPVNANGEPIDKTVILNEYSPVLYCDIHAQNEYSYKDSEHNSSTMILIDQWKKCAPAGFYLYLYSGDWMQKFEWGDNISTFAENFQLAVELNALGAHIDCDGGGFQACAFQRMYGYVYSKLQWNPYADTNKLVNDFITHYYREGAEEMREYYYLMETSLQKYCDDYIANGGYITSIHSLSWHKKGVLERGLELIDKAIAKINAVDAYTAQQKESYISRIEIEKFSPLYYLIQFHDVEYTAPSYLELVDEFEYLLKKYGVDFIKRNSLSNDQFIAQWRARKNA